MDLKFILRKLEFPNCAQETLLRIETLVVNRGKQDFVAELISEFIFLEKVEFEGRKPFVPARQMTSIEEFQLVVVFCEYFSRPGLDATRNALFISVFEGSLSPNRSSVLVKLISTAISGSVAPLLTAAGTWMQQIGCTSMSSLELAQHIVKDFIIFSKTASEQLKQLPLVAPRFAANFMTAVADLYFNEIKGEMAYPPDMLLEVITEWVSENPSLCLAALKPLSLPPGAIPMTVATPLAGLIRWCALAPIANQKSAYSKLHLSVLETLLQIPPAIGPPTSLNAQHLGGIVHLLKNQARKLINENIKLDSDENFQSSLERFAQAVQVSLTSKCMYGNITQFLCMLESLPANKLMTIVIKAHKNT